MAARASDLRFHTRLRAPAQEVYRAFTRACLLRDWFAHAAQADARAGGRLYLWWNDGEAVVGEYRTVVPDQKLVFTWSGRKDAGPSRVTVAIQGDGDATGVEVRHTLPGRSLTAQRQERALRQRWQAGLENLKSLLETGEDLRYTRRPMLGIMVGTFGREQAARMGIPTSEGVLIDDTVKGLGAAAAGLTKGDVLVAMGGRRLPGAGALPAVLQRFRAGDTVPVTIYRDSEKRTLQMTLSGRPLPAVPAEPRALGAEVQRIYRDLTSELEASLKGATEEAAGRRPAPDEWSAKHVLAHLIAGERDTQAWMAQVLEADEPVESPGNVAARIDALADALGTVPALLEALRREFEITVRMVEALPPDAAARKAAYWKIGHNLLQPAEHMRLHIGQIRAALAAA